MRGIQSRGCRAQCQRRFSPARAGNTPRWQPHHWNTAVQPRACGEYTIMHVTPSMTIGSAPRVRGIHDDCTFLFGKLRFSPARAGTTRGTNANTYWAELQPRACGEYASRYATRTYRRGSAPRVRGILFGFVASKYVVRFSPARAGNTPLRIGFESNVPVQPRACGEYLLRSALARPSPGSAPRVRGILTSPEQTPFCSRFSPARAGNTTRGFSLIAGNAVQPRACGEYDRYGSGCSDLFGSAPRVRGILVPFF